MIDRSVVRAKISRHPGRFPLEEGPDVRIPTASPGDQPPSPEDLPHPDWVIEEAGAEKRLFEEKQRRLLVQSLDHSWRSSGPGRPFLVLAGARVFYAVKRPPLRPAVLLSTDVCPGTESAALARNLYLA